MNRRISQHGTTSNQRPAAILGLGLLALQALGGSSDAASLQLRAPDLDKWYYSNASAPTFGGNRDSALLFATNSATENRLGYMVLGFETAGHAIPAGRGAGNYQVSSVKISLRVSSVDSFRYDPDNDTHATYATPALDANDPGRPVELFAVGFRNGFTRLGASATGAQPGSYLENSPYSSGAGASPTLFAAGLNGSNQLVDVATNVIQQFDYTSFAIGKTTEVAKGAIVPELADFTFSLDLTNPAILAYVQQGLNDGMLGFMVSSLHVAEGQGGGVTYPSFFTKEGAGDSMSDPFDELFAPRFEITYTVIPEPSASMLIIVGLALAASGRAWRNRFQMS